MATTQRTLTGKKLQKLTKKPKLNIRGVPESLYNRIVQEPDSFTSALKNNKNIKDYASFLQEFAKHLDKSPSGRLVKPYFFQDLDQEYLRIVFRSKSVKQAMEGNIGHQQTLAIYQQETASASPSVVSLPSTGSPVLSPLPVKVHSYRRGRVSIKAYNRGFYGKLNQPQKDFFSTRRKAGKTPKQVIAEYRQAFPMDSRSNASIKTHLYRAK